MKRVIAGIYAHLRVRWVGLNIANRYGQAKEGISGSPLPWHNVRYPLGLLLFIATYGALAATQVLFGPTVYTRDVAQPTTCVNVFEIPSTEGTFTLAVENGNSNTRADLLLREIPGDRIFLGVA